PGPPPRNATRTADCGDGDPVVVPDGEDDGGVVFTGSWPAGVGLVFEAAGVGGDEGFGFGKGLALGAVATDRHPPNAVRAPAMELVDEFKAHLVLERLNQMAARIRGNLVRIALAESMIHWPFVTPAEFHTLGFQTNLTFVAPAALKRSCTCRKAAM